MPSSETLSELLRNAVRGTELPLDRIAKAAGIGTPILWRFMEDGKDIRLQSAEKLAAYLGLTLAPVAKPRKKAAKKRSK